MYDIHLAMPLKPTVGSVDICRPCILSHIKNKYIGVVTEFDKLPQNNTEQDDILNVEISTINTLMAEQRSILPFVVRIQYLRE